jgi:hypothetical protein
MSFTSFFTEPSSLVYYLADENPGGDPNGYVLVFAQND